MNIELAALLSLALPILAQAQAPTASDPTAFTLALHRRVAGSANVMTSPYSMRQALGMASAGAAGGTRAEMDRVLGSGPAIEPDETIKIANALFVKKGYELRPGFLRTARVTFGAEVFTREFGQAGLDEEGTEAAAATAVVMMPGAAMGAPQLFRFVANRPFFFVIEEVKTGTILFIGEVHDPR